MVSYIESHPATYHEVVAARSKHPTTELTYSYLHTWRRVLNLNLLSMSYKTALTSPTALTVKARQLWHEKSALEVVLCSALMSRQQMTPERSRPVIVLRI